MTLGGAVEVEAQFLDTTVSAPRPGAVTTLHGVSGWLRVRQWIKNLLVFVAPAAAGVLTRPDDLWRACATFVCFCLASSACSAGSHA
jgi:decaprenyl-phosphate phosphoribosyltransferase